MVRELYFRDVDGIGVCGDEGGAGSSYALSSKISRTESQVLPKFSRV